MGVATKKKDKNAVPTEKDEFEDSEYGEDDEDDEDSTADGHLQESILLLSLMSILTRRKMEILRRLKGLIPFTQLLQIATTL